MWRDITPINALLVTYALVLTLLWLWPAHGEAVQWRAVVDGYNEARQVTYAVVKQYGRPEWVDEPGKAEGVFEQRICEHTPDEAMAQLMANALNKQDK